MARKSTDEILQKALSLKPDVVEFWRKALDGWATKLTSFGCSAMLRRRWWT